MAKNVTAGTANLSKKDLYFLTSAPTAQKMSEHEGERIDVAKWCIYEDEKEDGSSLTITAILTPEGEVFATNSATFRRSFLDVANIFDEGNGFAVMVTGGESKTGRHYIDCVYTD